MTYAERIINEHKAPAEVIEVVESLEGVRAAILRLEAVLHFGPSEGRLTPEEVKRLDKAVTVVKVGLKIAKKSLGAHDPKKRLIMNEREAAKERIGDSPYIK